ncbi:MAG: YggT family protein [Anaerolineae bacterium]|nr:YggT family protein [Anaerolineae bacterium]
MIGSTLAEIIRIAFSLFELLILARILISWFPIDPYNPIVQFLHQATEPILAPVRRRLPQMGMFDFSPMVVLIGAVLLQRILMGIVYNLF